MAGKHSFKDFLARVRVADRDIKKYKSFTCKGKRCQVCPHVKETGQIEDTDGSKYDIHKGIMNCNTNVIIYKFHCSSCSKQYIENNIKDFQSI